MKEILSYETFGDPAKPTLVILHGLLGSGKNWHTMARRLASDYYCVLPDARNHGASFHAEAHDYPTMAGDVCALADTLNRDTFHLVGHSMGGKTAMTLATLYPERLQSLTVVDIAPRAYPPFHLKELEAMAALPLEKIQRRKDADDFLATRISDWAMRQFLLANLQRDEDGDYFWRVHLDLLVNAVEGLAAHGTLDALSWKGPALFILGQESRFVDPADFPGWKKAFPAAQLQTIPGAGHNVHFDQPEAFYQALREFLG